MALLLPFIAFIVIAWFAQRIEQERGKTKVVKPEVRPTVEPHESSLKPERQSSALAMQKGRLSSMESTSTMRKKSHSNSGIQVTKDSVLNGIIMAEILSPPKCKRR